MENELEVKNEEIMVGMLSTNEIVLVAQQAEERIDAMKLIKNTAIKLTNGGDWVDQNGKPYLMVSGAEKIAAAFGISWDFLTPTCETDNDGHYTYTYHGKFTMVGRSLAIDGSRSSRDGFFKEYDYIDDGNGKKVKTEKPVDQRTNKRDVKMAALTNLIGNGITRMIGIRNMSYADLEQFANIKKADIGKVEYKGKKSETQTAKQKYIDNEKKTAQKAEPMQSPQNKAVDNEGEVVVLVNNITCTEGAKNGKPWTKTSVQCNDGQFYSTFSSTDANEAREAKEKGLEVLILYTTTEYNNRVYNNIESLTVVTADVKEDNAANVALDALVDDGQV